jgi:transcriptional regulator of acetoin/glycerol metabolism
VSIDFEPDRVQKVKDDFLTTAGEERAHNIALTKSWQRSQELLGLPANITDVPQVAEELLDAHLLDMFQAPLTRFSDSLDGTGLGLLLADSRGQILQRWCSDRSVTAHLDRIGTMRGAVLAESTVGTNGVGTVAATGHSVQIRGAEHFADFYSNAICTGAPVRHPMSGKLLAVVTLSCEVAPGSQFLRPLLRTVTTQLEQHVLDVEQPSVRRTFNTFLTMSRTLPDPVVAFGPQGLLVQNKQAGRLSTRDLNQIRLVCEDGVPSGKYALELTTGMVSLLVTTLDPGNTVVVVLEQDVEHPPVQVRSVNRAPRPELAGLSSPWLALVRDVSSRRSGPAPLIIAGEPGVGKTSLALGSPFRPDLRIPSRTLVDAAERHVAGRRKWLQQLSNRLTSGEPIVIRAVETLDPPALAGLRSVLESAPMDSSIVLTLTTGSREDAEAFGLKYGASCVWLPPLRERAADIPVLCRAFAATSVTQPVRGLSKETEAVLRAYRWPGNVRELRTVFAQVTSVNKPGPVLPSELPESMQIVKALSLIERVEVDAIRAALAEANGNRGRAAEILGLSKATVYRKLKAYRLLA